MIEKPFSSDRINFLIKLGIWIINGVLVAFLLIGILKLSIVLTTSFHPLTIPEVSASSLEKKSTNRKSWNEPSNLYLIKQNQDENTNQQKSEDQNDSLQEVNPDSVKKIEESELPFEVVGIGYGPEKFRVATLRNLESRNVKTLREGNGWKQVQVREIRTNEVIIFNNKSNQVEVLPLNRGKQTALNQSGQSDDNTRSMSRYQVNKAIKSNMNRLLQKIDVKPAFRRGQIIGIKLDNFQGRPGELLKELGFQPGDVLTRVNGEKINDINQAMKLWSSLRHSSNFDVRVQRDGEKLNFQYQLTR